MNLELDVIGFEEKREIATLDFGAPLARSFVLQFVACTHCQHMALSQWSSQFDNFKDIMLLRKLAHAEKEVEQRKNNVSSFSLSLHDAWSKKHAKKCRRVFFFR